MDLLSATVTPVSFLTANAGVTSCSLEQANALLDPAIATITIPSPIDGATLICEPLLVGGENGSEIILESNGSYSVAINYACSVDPDDEDEGDQE